MGPVGFELGTTNISSVVLTTTLHYRNNATLSNITMNFIVKSK